MISNEFGSILNQRFQEIYTMHRGSKAFLLTQVDEYGFKRPSNFDYKKHAEFMKYYLPILKKRERNWKGLKDHERNRKSRKLKRYIRKGIPKSERPMMWMLTSGAQALKDKSKDSYEKMKSFAYIISEKEVVDQIKRDIPRLFNKNIYFKKGEILPWQVFNICTTFAHQNAEVKYCQGIDNLAGFLLLVTKDEEMSFWILKALIENILPQYYITFFPGLLTEYVVLEELVYLIEPEVQNHLDSIGFKYCTLLGTWFVRLYTAFLPTETVIRIWDCLLYEGSQILLRVALLLIKIHKDELLCANEYSDVAQCLENMGYSSQVLNCHTFMEKLFWLPVSDSQVQKLRRKHVNATF